MKSDGPVGAFHRCQKVVLRSLEAVLIDEQSPYETRLPLRQNFRDKELGSRTQDSGVCVSPLAGDDLNFDVGSSPPMPLGCPISASDP